MRVLVSTSDKTGLIEFLKPLVTAGLELVSTGGTYEFLKKNNFEVSEVAELTKFPEVLDGRVKTLHPFVHMGLLADKYDEDHMAQMREHGVKSFDMVIGNLYPFEKTALKSGVTLEELIENIDIGGPSFLRASAKNYRSVVVVCSPSDYSWVQKKILANTLTDEDRKKLALKVFSLTSFYDALIVSRLAGQESDLEFLNIPLRKKQSLRYGENAQQKASWYVNPLQTPSLSDALIHQGKELSYNNLLDLESATQLVQTMQVPACVAVKHNNPCGVAIGAGVSEAAQKAIASDPKSIFGGIIAFNRTVDKATAELFRDIFIECIIAPAFSIEALDLFAAKKNLRVMTLPSLASVAVSFDSVKSISGGLLQQTADGFASPETWNFLGEKPNSDMLQTMVFGEKVCASLKSNAIALVYRGQSIGLGMGQVNRVDAVRHAFERMLDFCKSNAVNKDEVVLISDAFFPFPDSIEVISSYGIKWVVQPGGSVQDQKVIDAAARHGINMAMTHTRHFKH
jgi:phosphoribosylaminoimidazolecarboxamide formyltransferase/IMP cyclohydrolase